MAPLSVAAAHGRVDAARALLTARAYVQRTDLQGRSALWTAALNCHVDMVRCLMDANADAHQADQDGVTPLEISICGEVQQMLNGSPGPSNCNAEMPSKRLRKLRFNCA
eukprot:symbB.v1.2.020346.t1/scaffold1698.1/size105523/11